jgi:thiamine-monophosphate kinase
MREQDLLSHIYARSADLSGRFGAVLVGPGDDCAVVATPRGDTLLLTVDQVVEGRHFAFDAAREGENGATIAQVAHKAIARSISDIAAMGGQPAWALAAALLPARWPHADALFDAMAAAARALECPLVGGDIAMSSDEAQSDTAGCGIVLTVTVGGAPHESRGPVLRSGAKPGDVAYVTGALGGSLRSGRHLSFSPRISEGTWLCDFLGDRLHAMIDVSDGLGLDASRIGVASGARLDIAGSAIPRHGDADWRGAASDGEDYELLLTADAHQPLPPACPLTGTSITRIGRVVAGDPGCTVVAPDGSRLDGAALGWDHGA